MNWMVICALLIPLLGTTIGSAFVFFIRHPLNELVTRCMSGFAAGVMIAASIWSLLIPAMEQSESMGSWSFIPAAGGFWIGILFLLLMDKMVPHIHPETMEKEGPDSKLGRHTMLMLAVTLHNLPEGMAVGTAIAGGLNSSLITPAAIFALAIGIAIQNIPEGAIISMPLHSTGMSRGKAFLYGTLSGVVEPVGSLLTLMMFSWITPLLPWFLAFAAGAMMYVVVEELIPEMAAGRHSNIPALWFSAGFTIMMILDTVLG